MKALLAMTLIALTALAAAFLQYQQTEALRDSLQRSETAREALQRQADTSAAQLAASAAQQQRVQLQIEQLQENLRSSSAQLLELSNSLQEARQMMSPATP
jgi:chromosome segregation ATPase